MTRLGRSSFGWPGRGHEADLSRSRSGTCQARQVGGSLARPASQASPISSRSRSSIEVRLANSSSQTLPGRAGSEPHITLQVRAVSTRGCSLRTCARSAGSASESCSAIAPGCTVHIAAQYTLIDGPSSVVWSSAPAWVRSVRGIIGMRSQHRPTAGPPVCLPVARSSRGTRSRGRAALPHLACSSGNPRASGRPRLGGRPGRTYSQTGRNSGRDRRSRNGPSARRCSAPKVREAAGR